MINNGTLKKLSPVEFLEKLQKEYFICDIRIRFYPSPKDKEYYRKVRSYKKEKIDRICDQNKIPTIFTNEEVFSKYRSLVYSELDYPIFIEMTKKDWENYYALDCDVKIITDNDVLIGRTMKFYVGGDFITVKLREGGKEKIFKKDKVIRILSKEQN